MSELKDYKVYTTRHEGAWGYHYEPNPNKDQSDIELNGEQVYLKKDADRYIAHHKYKRCLDKAKWCKLWYEEEKNDWQLKDVHHWLRMSLFDKWYKKWLELAEKFKEAQ